MALVLDADAALGIVSLNGPSKLRFGTIALRRVASFAAGGWMRAFATACVVLATILGTSTSRADGAFDFAQAERLRKDKRLEVAGIALTAVGAASYGAALGLFFSDHSINGSPTHGSTEIDAWAITTAVGAIVFLGAGIPLWVVGARRLRADRRTVPSAAR